MTLVCALAWAIFGAGYAALVHSFSAVTVGDYPRLVAVCCLGRTLGFLAVFAPDGLGVRESVYLLGLSPLVGQGTALAITISARLWSAAAEFSLAGLGGWFVRNHPAAPREPAGVDPPDGSEASSEPAAKQMR